MSIAPPRICARCGRQFKTVRCAHCRRKDDLARGSARARGYDEQWTAYARAWLQVHPWCGERVDGTRNATHSRCTADGQRVKADIVDHIVPIAAGGPRLDSSNHQSLCRSCNAAKAAGADVATIRTANEARRTRLRNRRQELNRWLTR